MDVALALEKLAPAAEYFGSLTDNTKQAYEAIQWIDQREKPSWSDIQAAHAPATPARVTMRQARLALHADELLQSVEDAINAMPEPGQTAARIEWDHASQVERSSQFVAVLGAAIGLDDAMMDELFIAASKL